MTYCLANSLNYHGAFNHEQVPGLCKCSEGYWV